MKTTSLVIMAAGIGSRFGGGIKQLEPVGPSGEIIMDYSIYDALQAGFDKIVFVIRKDLDEDFKQIIGNRIEKFANVEYVYQELDDLPKGYTIPENRKKPWGTGQAVLCCKDKIDGPFAVINADDFYGKDSFVKLYESLQNLQERSNDVHSCVMMGFVLGNTLSDNGGVTRGVCVVDQNNKLQKIKEIPNIEKTDTGAKALVDGKLLEIDLNHSVSMNMWGFMPSFLDELENGFERFLNNLGNEEKTKEYLLPRIVGDLLKNDRISVHVVNTLGNWFGVTYKEDKAEVVGSIQKLVAKGEYPQKLFG